MSETPTTEKQNRTAAASTPANGAMALHTRIADLLDDVTVTDSSFSAVEHSATDAVLSPQAPLATSGAAPTHAMIPDPASESYATGKQADGEQADGEQATESMLDGVDNMVAPPSPNAPDSNEQSSTHSALPGEPLVWTSRRNNVVPPGDLPPFLQNLPTREGGAPVPASPQTVAGASQSAPVAPLVEDSALADGEDGTPAVANQLVNIRGRGDGVAIEIGKGSWNEIINVLTERLEKSASFFRHSSVALDIGSRPLREDELQQIAGVLTAHEMMLGVVRTSSERTFQSALAIGMTTTLESPEGAPVAAATTAATNVAERGTETTGYFVYRGYLRSGHRLRRQESILVIGDINPGAEVISDGDILVWGRLRGVVHAGAGGNRRALVAALDLEPTQMRIAEVTTIGPDPKPGQPGRFFWRRSQHKRPEIARLVQSEIVIEEWDAARPGGLVSLRRGAG
jgi:septum site-determining protein MinC